MLNRFVRTYGRTYGPSAGNVLYGDLTVISQTITSITTLIFLQTLEFHPSGEVFVNNFKGVSEIIVGETIVSSNPHMSVGGPRRSALPSPGPAGDAAAGSAAYL